MNDPELIEIEGASALLYRDAPSFEGVRTAAVGGFACEDAAGGRRLLEKAKILLRGEGFQAILGPMDGDTWRRYRLVSETDGSPPFAMEPTSGPHDQAAFVAAGFAPVSEYVSSRAKLAEAVGADAPSLPGVEVTAWDGQGVETLTQRMFEMSLAGFARNRFFKPISREAFVKLYEPVMPLVDPRLILFAHAADGRLAGFLFGLPNRLEGAAPRTVILKTYASGMRGLGHILADSFHRRAIALGYVDVIHALMHVDNISRERSARHGATIFRRYALMGARL